ncbi:hypothetical protein [Bradyrhizobium sp. CCGUVB23]|uniref:hypothetical protein n=1 Tax=Bradyrhizobium sp. CCGUVB23 TaxID=2949630 RepID=UPI0020B34D24|nr:hypothetical protein [Bradyrhizobium sp. CCGUVB23]MCP3460173.1 hypothetical protein [Bradyrhizobium sp. CCGUVB23]
MTENVWIALIVAIAAVIVVFAVRRRLTKADIQSGSLTASLTAQTPSNTATPGVSNNTLLGRNEVETVEGGTVAENALLGANKVKVQERRSPREPSPPSA